MVLKIRTWWTDDQAAKAGVVVLSDYEAWHYVEGRSFSIYTTDLKFDSEGQSGIEGEENFVCGASEKIEIRCHVALYFPFDVPESEVSVALKPQKVYPVLPFPGMQTIYFNTAAYLLNERGSTVECIPAIVPVQNPETGVRSFLRMR